MTRNYQEIADAWLREDASALGQLNAAERRALGLIASGASADREFDAAGVDFVRGMKATNMARLASITGGHVTRADAPDNVLTFVYSDERVDRAGDIIVQDWNLDNYGFRALGNGAFARTGTGNPVGLWGHARSSDMMADVPISRTVAIRIEGGRTIGDLVFAVDEYPFAAQIYRLAKSKFINTGSVGFKPEKVDRVDDVEERERLGLGRGGVVFRRSELLEYSLCAIPCNAGALQEGIKSGSIEEKDADLFSAITDPTEREWEKLVRRRARSWVAFTEKGAAERHSSDSDSGAGTSGSGGAPSATDLADLIATRAERELTPSERYIVDAIYTMRGVIADNAKATAALAAALADDAASRRELARGLTALQASITPHGAPRAVDTARSGADAAVVSAQDAAKLLAEIQEVIRKR